MSFVLFCEILQFYKLANSFDNFKNDVALAVNPGL